MNWEIGFNSGRVGVIKLGFDPNQGERVGSWDLSCSRWYEGVAETLFCNTVLSEGFLFSIFVY